MIINKPKQSELGYLVDIVKALPIYFLPEHLSEIEADVRSEENIVIRGNDEKIIGFINYLKNDKNATINWMAVAPEHQSAGAGTTIMNHFLKTMKESGVATVTLETLASTSAFKPFEGTRKFYKKFGFTEIRIDKNYYGNGDDRAIMNLSLN